MNYKEKLEEFIKDLNNLLSDTYLFPEQKRGRFWLSINDSITGLVIDLWFKENGINHVIYHRAHGKSQGINHEQYFGQAYLEIFRNAFLAVDCVNKLQDGNERMVNVLSFNTLLTSGLEKLK